MAPAVVDMRRRTALTAVAAAAASSLAGCLSDALAGAPAGTEETPGSDDAHLGTGDGTPGTDDETAEPPGAQWGTCPSFVENADRTVCYRDHGDADVSLAPSKLTFEEYGGNDAVETVTFTLHNRDDASFRLNPQDWAVKRLTDDGWIHVAPDEHVDPLHEVPPGGTYEWVLGTQQHTSPRSDDSTSVTVDLSSAERYAFRVHGWFGEADEGPRIEAVARFEYLLAVPGGEDGDGSE